MTGRVEGKVALITGAARGQGRSHAIRLAEEGADVIAIDICEPVPEIAYAAATPGELEETRKEVESRGRRIVTGRVDIRDLDALTAFTAEAVEQLGRLDIVVANAGVMLSGEWHTITPAMWQTLIDVNLTGTWNTFMATVPILVEQNSGGSMMATSSVGGLKGLPFMVPYTASKHGVVGVVRGFAHELAKYNIRVNSIHPTGVRTEMGIGAGGAGIQAGLEENPRIGGLFVNSMDIEYVEPEDISNAVLWLASDESRYVTASAMTIDGGNTEY